MQLVVFQVPMDKDEIFGLSAALEITFSVGRSRYKRTSHGSISGERPPQQRVVVIT